MKTLKLNNELKQVIAFLIPVILFLIAGFLTIKFNSFLYIGIFAITSLLAIIILNSIENKL